MPTGSDFSRVDLGKPDQGSYKNHGDSSQLGGEYGYVNPESTLPEPAQGNYPNPFGYGYDSDNRMFSQDKENDPKALDAAKTAGEDKFLAMQKLLQTTNYTVGSPICHGFESADQQGETDQDPPYPGKR